MSIHSKSYKKDTSATDQVLQEVASTVSLSGIEFLDYDSEGTASWYSYKGHRLHCRPMGGFLVDIAHLREKLYSDIAYDLHIPQTSTCFSRDTEHWGQQRLSVSVEPFPNSQQLGSGDYCRGTDASIMTPRLFAEFFQNNHSLIPSFMALSLFDLWIYNRDRNVQNVLIAHGSPTPEFNALCGIDLNRCSPHGFKLKQEQVIRALITEDVFPAIHATMSAIAGYPKERIRQLADRLCPISRLNDEWNPVAETEILIHSRKTLARRFSELVPSQLSRKLELS